MTDFRVKRKNTIEELQTELQAFKKIDSGKVSEAYDFLTKNIENSKRKSGDDYYSHCLTVAWYVAQLTANTEAIVAAVLHNVLSLEDVEIDKIDELFGTEVAFILDGLKRIKELSGAFNPEHSGEEMTNLIFNASEDVRIIIVRLADKLDGILTTQYLDPEKKEITAKKIQNIYAPLAEYMGLGAIHRIMQDEAFRILKPEEYEHVVKLVGSISEQESEQLKEIEGEIRELLKEKGMDVQEIYSRRKGIYSSYNKLEQKYLRPDQKITDMDEISLLQDIFAVRIIVDTLEECYLVLGLLHSTYEYNESEFDDYISLPKENGYKSIHTVPDFEGQDVEVQIRTKEMHEYNEFGPASHIAYKQGLASTTEKEFTWTKDLHSWIDEEGKYKVSILKDSIFVFTPKGKVIRLPKGAKPLDFAFRIHSGMAVRYRGALVNSKMVSMDTELETGDVVEIIPAKEINVTRDWLNHVVSKRARRRIKRQLNKIVNSK